MKLLGALPIVAGVLTMLIPGAYADEWNKKTILTFSSPVEIPGQVLSPGTYVFKLQDSQADRNIVQVFNKNEDHLYGTFLTVPDYRLQPTGKTVIMFEERAAGSPQAVKAWFYPGDVYGNDFVYPKRRATQLAKNTNQPVPSMPDEMEANTKPSGSGMNEAGVTQMRQYSVRAQRPGGEEVAANRDFQTSPSAQTASNARPANSQANSAPQANNGGNSQPTQMASNTHPARQLPQTASYLPLIALMGTILLGGGASLLAVSRVTR